MPSLKSLGAYAALIGASEVLAQGVGDQTMRVISPLPQVEHLRLNVSYDTVVPKYHPVFPCYQEAKPEAVERVPFPIRNGRLQIQSTGTRYDGPVLFPDGVTGDWRAAIYIGGFEGLSVGGPDAFRISPTDYYVDYKEFEAETVCGPPLPAVTEVVDEPFLNEETSSKPIQRYPVPQDELDGLNATIAIAFVHFAPDGKSNEYMLTQVSIESMDSSF
jgi:hypothetical protein